MRQSYHSEWYQTIASGLFRVRGQSKDPACAFRKGRVERALTDVLARLCPGAASNQRGGGGGGR